MYNRGIFFVLLHKEMKGDQKKKFLEWETASDKNK